ncbi:hypothetical protein FHS29_001548 [Saccharothrix tamanrassetensis]|uniref:Uncharacterized protein n=1 Tax=Saccharothrix tamanrassetensis TaxID=1051531 RepID=A0A841CFL9_9PSEU|nr:hypothetical protein [Saccharothrix tamanrassetensis]MBB5954978.1 hypothetical protein [Saccharothrix tamanrassetensis]
MNCTISRVACWAMGMPAVDAPKVPKAAATSAAISMASAISDAMIDSLVYSTSSAVLSQLSASCSQIFWSFGRYDSSPSANFFQYSSNRCTASPVWLPTTVDAAPFASSITDFTPCAAVR